MLSKLRVIGVRRLCHVAVSIVKHGFTLMALLDSVKSSRAALKDDKERLSYNDLYLRSLAYADYLSNSYNIGAGSKVILACNNSVSFLSGLFGVSGLGADIFLVNPGYKKEYFRNFLSDKDIGLIICDESLEAELSGLGIPVFCHEKPIPISANLKVKAVTRKRGSITILSSGSKGKPKKEKRNLALGAFIDPLVDIMTKLRLVENRKVLISVPVFHGYGLAALLLAVFLGKDICLAKKFDVVKTIAVFEDEEIDCWIVVPLMVQKLFLSGYQPAHLKKIVSGGDVLPEAVVRKVRSSSIEIFNLYGTSESGVCTIATDQDLERFPGTIGRRIRGIRTKIINDSSELSLTGQLLVKSAWSSDGSGSFVATGDVVRIDGDYYFYVGRKDDMIVIGGENIYPSDLETIIYKYPGISWTKAAPETDQNGIKVISVSLVVSDASFNKGEFMEWLSGRVPKFMMPKLVSIIDKVPDSKLM